MINLPVPNDIEPRSLSQLLSDILRRSVDGTITASATDSAGSTALGADMKVVNAGKGLVMITRGGSGYGRVLLENADENGNMALSVDPISAPSGTNAGDIQILTAGGGLVVPTRDGSALGRIILEDADENGNIAIAADPGATYNSAKDIAILTAGFGMVLPSRDGLRYGRLLIENADENGNVAIGVDPI